MEGGKKSRREEFKNENIPILSSFIVGRHRTF
jgi:hypothetical protein